MNKNITAAFFDIDHTLTSHSTAIRCVLHNLKRGRFPLRFLFSMVKPYYQYKRGTMNLQNCNDLIEGMDGFARDMMDDMGFNSFEKYSQRDLFPEMVAIVKKYQKKGIPVILATSSPRFVVEPYCQYFKADHIIATELEFDENNLTSGRFSGPVAFDKGKRMLVEQYIQKMGYDKNTCAFYSDSIHDLPTLELVGYPIAVNPDRDLRKEAVKRQWDILLPR